jgi:hypothetical protein
VPITVAARSWSSATGVQPAGTNQPIKQTSITTR